MAIFSFAIKSLILELQNCMSNPSATVSVLFDSSPFATIPETSKKQVGTDNLMINNATTKAEIRLVSKYMVCSR